MAKPFKPNAEVLTRVNETLATESCQKFMRQVLNNASTDKNPVLEGGDIQKIFAAFLQQKKGGISRETKTAYGSAVGKIQTKEGKGNGVLHLPAIEIFTEDEQNWLDARGIVNELPHIAGTKGGWPREEYDDYALACAVFKAGYDELFTLKGDMPASSPWKGSKNPLRAYPDFEAVPKIKMDNDEVHPRYDPRWSNYFHDIVNQLCVVRR